MQRYIWFKISDLSFKKLPESCSERESQSVRSGSVYYLSGFFQVLIGVYELDCLCSNHINHFLFYIQEHHARCAGSKTR